MKKRRLLIGASIGVVVVLVAVLLLTLTHPWTSMQTTSPGANANGTLPIHLVGDDDQIHMISDMQGWATADGVVYHTSDGARHWQRVYSYGTADIYSFTSPTNALLSVKDENHPGPITGFAHTENGGKRWQKTVANNQTAVDYYPLTFIDDQQGLFFSLDYSEPAIYTLWHTSDAGKHWQKLFTSAYNDLTSPMIHAASFVNTQLGWGVDFRTYAVYKTTDGGQSWQHLASAFTPAAPQLPPTDWQTAARHVVLGQSERPVSGSLLTYFHFFTPQDGMMHIGYEKTDAGINIYDTETIYITHDGGLHWQQTGSISEPSYLSKNQATWGAKDGQSLWYQSINHTNKISFSTDGGQHWQVTTVQMPTRYLRVINFTSSTIGWAYGYDRYLQNGLYNPIRLLKTVDGGLSWHEIARSSS